MDKTSRMRDYLTDGHISVRRYHIDDASALYEAVHESIAELTRWGFYHPGFNIQDAERDVISRIKDWNEGKSYKYLIEALPGPVLIGNCGVSELKLDKNQAALGWWVRTSKTGRGIATAAARLVARAAFEDLQLCVLNIYAKVDNYPSRRVAEKIGATLAQIKTEEDRSRTAVYQLKPNF